MKLVRYIRACLTCISLSHAYACVRANWLSIYPAENGRRIFSVKSNQNSTRVKTYAYCGGIYTKQLIARFTRIALR